MSLALLLGGARSGKSSLAVRLAASGDDPVVVIATAEARDADMAERIRRHRSERPSGWTTVEEPLRLGRALARAPEGAFVILDCLSLWVSNRMEAGDDGPSIDEAAAAAAAAASGRPGPTLCVSNEVGLGIVPDNALAREYRDILGRVNRTFADVAASCGLVVAGRILPLHSPDGWRMP